MEEVGNVLSAGMHFFCAAEDDGEKTSLPFWRAFDLVAEGLDEFDQVVSGNGILSEVGDFLGEGRLLTDGGGGLLFFAFELRGDLFPWGPVLVEGIDEILIEAFKFGIDVFFAGTEVRGEGDVRGPVCGFGGSEDVKVPGFTFVVEMPLHEGRVARADGKHGEFNHGALAVVEIGVVGGAIDSFVPDAVGAFPALAVAELDVGLVGVGDGFQETGGGGIGEVVNLWRMDFDLVQVIDVAWIGKIVDVSLQEFE